MATVMGEVGGDCGVIRWMPGDSMPSDQISKLDVLKMPSVMQLTPRRIKV